MQEELLYMTDEDSAQDSDIVYVIDSGNEAEWGDDTVYVID
jgi:hypothetical protein